MKTIGLIGGTSWESSIEYYRILNETVKDKLGGLHSAKCLMNSVEFQEVVDLMQSGNWEALSILMQSAARVVKNGGADFLLICSNTLHRYASAIEESIGIPVHGIADAAAHEIKKTGLQKVGLLGTKYAMEGDYYKNTLQGRYGIETIIPGKDDRERIDSIIFKELCVGVINDDSRRILVDIINQLHSKGAEGIVLGCTEIPLLIKQKDVNIPVFDTMTIHATSAVEKALESSIV